MFLERGISTTLSQFSLSKFYLFTMAHITILFFLMTLCLYFRAESKTTINTAPGYPSGSSSPALDTNQSVMAGSSVQMTANAGQIGTPAGFPSGSKVFALKNSETKIRMRYENQLTPSSVLQTSTSQTPAIKTDADTNEFNPLEPTPTSNGKRNIKKVPENDIPYDTEDDLFQAQNGQKAQLEGSGRNEDIALTHITGYSIGAPTESERTSSKVFLVNMPKLFMRKIFGRSGIQLGTVHESRYVTESEFAFDEDFDARGRIESRRPRFILDGSNDTTNGTSDLLQSIKEIALRMVEKEEFLLFATISGCFCLVALIIQWILCLSCRLCVRKHRIQTNNKIYNPVDSSDHLLLPPPTGDVKSSPL